jgi:16S rRNA (cytosine967-C5)-methyltransferase
MAMQPGAISPGVDPTRNAAFDLINAVVSARRSLDDALAALGGIEPRDRAAAHRIAGSVLRRLGSLDAVLEPFLKKVPPDPVRHILRIGAASLLLLETPPHAAVATAVALTRQRGLIPFVGLVNAVLRRVAEHGAEALAQLDGPRLDTPSWLWTSWGAHARAIARAHLIEAPLDLSLLPGAAAPEGGEKLPTGSWRYPAGTRVAELAGFEQGNFWVQDAAASLPAALLAAQPGERVADLCAAPGGKTAQLAATGASVTAIELNPSRMARVAENLGRLKLSAEMIAADAATWRPATPLDAVLLDAPCTATGTIRRHPDVPHIKRPRDVQAMIAQQDRLLDAAADMLRPGGRLVYAVCSLQPEEGAPRIARALENLPFRAAPFTPADLPCLPEAITPEGHLRTLPSLWPGRGGMDGFFAARLVRI